MSADGVSLVQYLKGATPDSKFLQRNLYFHYPHYRTTMPHSAVVSAQRKLIHFYEQPEIPMLFDLSNDAGEVHNIARVHLAEHKQMYDEMISYFESVGARIPKINPHYDPAAYEKSKEYPARMRLGPFEGRRTLDEDEI